ncbi:MAG: Uma2 family endonuclease [Chthonomonadetes bacterium]|nr:Uma2 family endonuclease [Chthonomonadetes bacterium]
MSQTLSRPPSRPLPEGKITFEQFLQWLDQDTHAEWVDGEVRIMSPVRPNHQHVVVFLTNLLSWWLARRLPDAVLLTEPVLMKLPGDLPAYSPDILILLPENAGRERESHVEGPADLVVEVISPESRARDRGEKFENYEKAGVREYWLIDPERRRAEFYALGEDGFYEPITADAQGVIHSRVLEGLWVKPEWFWQKPLPSLLSVFHELGLR